MTYRPHVDGLRAIAVLAVALYHIFPAAAPGGYVGVDVFFVISGFLITGIIDREMQEGRFSAVAFYKRRARRILPALFAMMATVLAGAALLYSGTELRLAGEAAVATTLFAANLHYWNAIGYFAAAPEIYPLLHTWSLAVEEQFYFIFPLLLLMLRRRAPGLRIPAVAITAVLSFVIAVAMMRAGMGRGAFYLPHARWWELAAGALLALGRVRMAEGRAADALSLLGLAGVLVPVALYSHATPFPGLAAAPPVLGAVALIAAGERSLAGRLLSLRPMIAVGLISYSFYLWHWPVIVTFEYLALRTPGPAEAAGLLALSLALGALSTRFVERPFRSGPAFGDARRVALWSGAGMAAMLAIGLVAALRDPYGGAVAAAPPPAAERAAFACPRPAFDLAPFAGSDGRICGSGDNPDSNPDVALWGDSHALMAGPGLRYAAAARGLSVLALSKNGCPPLQGIERLGASDVDRCAPWNAAVLDRLIALRPRLVVLAARWALAHDGLRYGGEAGEPVLWAHDGVPGNAAAFREGLDATLAGLERAGIPVILLGQVPEIGWDVTSVLSRRDRLGLTPPPAPDAADYARRNAASAAVMARLAAAHGAQLFDTAALTCAAGPCQVETAEGARLYADDDHPSFTAAKRIGEALLASPAAQAATGR